MLNYVRSQLSKYLMNQQAITKFVTNPQNHIIIKHNGEYLNSFDSTHSIKIINFIENSCQNNVKDLMLIKFLNKYSGGANGKCKIMVSSDKFYVKFIKMDSNDNKVIIMTDGKVKQKYFPLLKNKKLYCLPNPDMYLLLSDGSNYSNKL